MKRLERMKGNLCDICHRRRGGGNPIDHSKCAEIRARRAKEGAK